MPLFDWLGGTINPKAWGLHKEIISGKILIYYFVLFCFLYKDIFLSHPRLNQD